MKIDEKYFERDVLIPNWNDFIHEQNDFYHLLVNIWWTKKMEFIFCLDFEMQLIEYRKFNILEF